MLLKVLGLYAINFEDVGSILVLGAVFVHASVKESSSYGFRTSYTNLVYKPTSEPSAQVSL